MPRTNSISSPSLSTYACGCLPATPGQPTGNSLSSNDRSHRSDRWCIPQTVHSDHIRCSSPTDESSRSHPSRHKPGCLGRRNLRSSDRSGCCIVAAWPSRCYTAASQTGRAWSAAARAPFPPPGCAWPLALSLYSRTMMFFRCASWVQGRLLCYRKHRCSSITSARVSSRDAQSRLTARMFCRSGPSALAWRQNSPAFQVGAGSGSAPACDSM